MPGTRETRRSRVRHDSHTPHLTRRTCYGVGRTFRPCAQDALSHTTTTSHYRSVWPPGPALLPKRPQLSLPWQRVNDGSRHGDRRLERQGSAAKREGGRGAGTGRGPAGWACCPGRERPPALSPGAPAPGPRLREWLKEVQSHAGLPPGPPALPEGPRGERVWKVPSSAPRSAAARPASRFPEREQCGGQRSAFLNSLSGVLRRQARPSRPLEEGPRARALQSESLWCIRGAPAFQAGPTDSRERLWRTGTGRWELPARP